MYLEHFGLRERPFSNAPDPRFTYLGEHHEPALAHLLRSVQAQGGVAHLIGASGIGKTTMCRMLLSRLPERVDVALILNPVPTPQELLSAVCDELGVAYGKDASSLILGDSLYRKQVAGLGQRRTVVIVDEAQSLGLDVLEQLYLLSSLEIDGRKLLGIILIGEPWLVDLLARAAPNQPSRSTGYHLLPLTENETRAYVRHRMVIAGGRRNIFDVDALRDVHHLSSGVPRLINTICARALLGAVAQRRRRVDRSTVRAAARSVLAPAGSPAIEVPDEAPGIEPVTIPRKSVPAAAAARARRGLWPWFVSGGLVLNAVVIGAILLAPHQPVSPPPDTRAEVETSAAGRPATIPPSPPPTAQAVEDPPRKPIAQPVPAARPIAPPPARPTSLAPAPPASPEETPRQRRRRERSDLRSSITSMPPAPDQMPPPEAPQLKIDMLVWANEPRERMVYVNGQKYVEGQTLENGTILERIEEDGIVVIQEGQRHRLRAEGH